MFDCKLFLSNLGRFTFLVLKLFVTVAAGFLPGLYLNSISLTILVTLCVPLYPLDPAPTVSILGLVVSVIFFMIIESPTFKLCGNSLRIVTLGSE